MKKILYILLVAMLLVGPVYAKSVRQLQVSFVDEFGQPITTITSITVFNAAAGSSPTIYADRGASKTMVNPITTSSTNTTFDQSAGIVRWFQTEPDYKLTVTDGTKTLTVDNRNESDTNFAWYDNYIGTAASLSVSDNQSITVGTDSDMVLAWVNGSNFMSWIPAADGSAFNLGTSGTAKNVDFNVYVDTALGFKLNEGAATLVIDGMTTSINTSSNFATNINTGTSTGAVTIGSSTSGTLAFDTTSGITVNADDSYALTVSAGTIDIDSTGGDLGIDATDKSILIDGGEAVDDAITITATGAAGGIDITSLGDIDITTTGAAGEDINITNTGGTIAITSTENIQNSMHIEVNGGTSESINLYSNQGTGVSASTEHDASVQLQSDDGGISLYTTANLANAIRVEANAGTSETITIQSVQGTSVTEGAASVNLFSTVGGISIKSTANLAKAIQIVADSGTTETIYIQADQGNGVASIELVSDAGGITITAAKPLKLEAALTLNDIRTISDSDDTPDVGGFSFFKTGTVTDTIDDFDGTNIEEGQIIVVISEGAITYDVTGGALICGTTDLITADGDVTMWIYDGTNWQLLSWMDDAVDQNARG